MQLIQQNIYSLEGKHKLCAGVVALYVLFTYS